MISCWHVLRTYLGRKRFWLLGGILTIWLWNSYHAGRVDPADVLMLLTVPTILSNILMAFLALHVRRQFGSPQAKLVPGFAGPHFFVAAVLATLVWLAWPLAMGWAVNYTPWPLVGVSAVGAVIFALIVWWPRAFVVVAFVPVVSIMLAGEFLTSGKPSLTEQFSQGHMPLLYIALIALAVLAYPLAAWKLLWMNDLAVVGAGDDIVMEPRATDYSRGKFNEWISTWRDHQIGWRISHRGRHGATVGLRQLASAASWNELLLFCGAVVAMAAALRLLIPDPAVSMFVTCVGGGLMLFMPISLWRFRCNALASESLLPATRREFAGQMVMAMAADFVIWTSGASAVTLAGYAMTWNDYGHRGWGPAGHLMLVWALATAIYGVGIFTLRYRYWLPVFVALFIGTLFVAFYVATIAEALYRGSRYADEIALYSLPGTVTAVGLLLAWATYHIWRHIDLT